MPRTDAEASLLDAGQHIPSTTMIGASGHRLNVQRRLECPRTLISHEIDWNVSSHPSAMQQPLQEVFILQNHTKTVIMQSATVDV